MRVLVVGSGGREHALAWKLAQSPVVDGLFAAPGNPGIAQHGTVVDIAVDDLSVLGDFAAEHGIDLTVVGPEAPLIEGIADHFESRDLAVFGPSAGAARIEGSKVFCREFAARQGIPMAPGESFDDPQKAATYARSVPPPVVVKADGLAAGKGVVICADHDEAVGAIEVIMRGRLFGESGSRLVVEHHLTGREATILALCDGRSLAVMDAAQDYKRANDGDQGPNTGGMGSCSPVPWLTTELRDRAVREVVEPIVHGLADEGTPFRGCLYAQLMITEDGPRLIEVNARFGDPEAQVLLPRLETDLAQAFLDCVHGKLDPSALAWSDEACVCVVVASGGYPGDYTTGLPIGGTAEAESMRGVTVFHAGTALDGDRLVSAGGRVLNVVATGRTLADARTRAYEAVDVIRLENKQFRTDIAKDFS